MAVAEALAASKVKVLVAGLVVVGGGGAAAYAATGGFGASGANLADTVPAGVDAVVYADMSVARDGTTATLVNGYINVTQQVNPAYDGPGSYQEFVIRQSGGENLSAGGLNEAIAYGRYPNQSATDLRAVSTTGYFGVVFDAEWSEDELVAELSDGDAETREYEGYTVYVVQSDRLDSPPMWVGVLDSGQYVLGTANATKDALDTDRGASDTFGGELRSEYENTREDGYLRFAAEMPTERIPDTREYETLRTVETVAGSYYTEGDEIGIEARMTTGSSSDADDLQSIVEGSLASASQFTTSEDVAAVFDNVSVEQDGNAVTVTVQMRAEAVVDSYEAALDGLFGQFAGLSGSASVSGSVSASEMTTEAAD